MWALPYLSVRSSVPRLVPNFFHIPGCGDYCFFFVCVPPPPPKIYRFHVTAYAYHLAAERRTHSSYCMHVHYCTGLCTYGVLLYARTKIRDLDSY